MSSVADHETVSPTAEAGPATGVKDAISANDGPAPSAVRRKRIAVLAASLIVAAGLGSAAGALAGAALIGAPARTGPAEPTVVALGEQLSRLESEIAALKGSVAALGQNATAQFARIGERIEKAQAEPAARLTRLSDSIDRIERRTGAPDITGSIGETQKSRLPVIEGWTLREIFNGAALVENRYALFEVVPGSQIPGVGRVESIRRQDGRWVVVTAKGLIVPTR